MPELLVRGGGRLEGELIVQGSKNSSLPIIAASIMTEDTTVIENCPDISDVREMLDILTDIGCRCSFEGGRVTVKPAGIEGAPDVIKCRKFRASSILMGALLATLGYFVMPYPGGCNIGKRPLNFHIKGFSAIGAVIEERDGLIIGCRGKLQGGYFRFPYPSVGALENVILAAVKAGGVTILDNCATEPEICDLCDFLTLMGADIDGAGERRITIRGVRKLHGAQYRIPGDRIAAGTYMSCCACAGGNIKISGIEPSRISNISDVLRKAGCRIFTYDENNEIIIMSDERCRSVGHITAGPYPEFPTDMQPQLMSVAACMSGMCLIEDKVFESRYAVAGELNRMGADIKIDDGKAFVTGVERLHGETVASPDLRGGAALVAAALNAEGDTVIKNCDYIRRGYEDIQRDLKILGADIQWRQEEKRKKQ